METEVCVQVKVQELAILESLDFEDILRWSWANARALARATRKPADNDIAPCNILSEEIMRHWEFKNPNRTWPTGLQNITEAIIAQYKPRDRREIKRILDHLLTWHDPTTKGPYGYQFEVSARALRMAAVRLFRKHDSGRSGKTFLSLSTTSHYAETSN